MYVRPLPAALPRRLSLPKPCTFTAGWPERDELDLLHGITSDPTIFGGKPIIRNHRLAVEHVLGMLAAGDSVWPRSQVLPSMRALREVYVDPDVVRWDQLDEDVQTKERVADWRGTGPGGERTPQRVAWRRMRLRSRQAVLLGRPGDGKTTITRMTARTVARVAARHLPHQRRPIPALTLPVWVTARAVLEKGSVGAAVEDAASKMVGEALRRHRAITAAVSPGPAAAHLAAAGMTEGEWLFIDALYDGVGRENLRAEGDPLRVLRGGSFDDGARSPFPDNRHGITDFPPGHWAL